MRPRVSSSPARSSSAAVAYGRKELASRISPRTVRITAAHVAVPSSKMTPGPDGPAAWMGSADRSIVLTGWNGPRTPDNARIAAAMGGSAAKLGEASDQADRGVLGAGGLTVKSAADSARTAHRPKRSSVNRRAGPTGARRACRRLDGLSDRGGVSIGVPHLAQPAETGPVRGDLCVFGPCMVILFLAAAAGQADSDVEAAGGHCGCIHGAAVYCGDR